MKVEDIFRQYQELQAWVGWTEDCARRVAAAAALLEPHLPGLVADFYQVIQRHPQASKVITGGPAQIGRLQGTLLRWLRELLAGRYDQDYVGRRWQVGWRHVEIGLEQVYTNVAMSRLRFGLVGALRANWPGMQAEFELTVEALHKLLDLDLAIIEHAYQAEYADRAQRSERLATIGQVAGGVAHELRNPLNVVKTSVYYLLHARQPTAEKRAEHLQRIERHVVLADGVITALSNFAKMPVPSQAPFVLERCIQEALETNPVPASITVGVQCPAELRVCADVDQVRIVFANLIRNAREAMNDGGRLTIMAHVRDSQVAVDVTDSGAGIAPEHLGRIMEPLYSTKAKGLGLGLAIARAILEKNNGALQVNSVPGTGSTFTVVLKVETAPHGGAP